MAQESQAILGIWKASSLHQSDVKIYNTKGGNILAKVAKSDKESWADEVIMRDLFYSEAKNEWEGKFYIPGINASLKLRIKVTDKETLECSIKKYFLVKNFKLIK